MLDIVSVMRAISGDRQRLSDVKGYAAAEALRRLPAGPEGFFGTLPQSMQNFHWAAFYERGCWVWHEIANKIHDWYYKALWVQSHLRWE